MSHLKNKEEQGRRMNDKRNCHGAVGNVNNFRKSAAITFVKFLEHLAEPGLKAGRQAGRQADDLR